MINNNGHLIPSSEATVPVSNRGLAYGDALFETIKTLNGKILFWEDHYFRLMASMRILRMEIPMAFTPEFLESQILDLLTHNKSNSNSFRVKLTVFRKQGGFYTPDTNDVNYFISADSLESDLYLLNNSSCTIELFKDFYVSPGVLSTLKTNNKVLNVLGSVYAKENQGIMRKQVIEILKKLPDYECVEAAISPFELQKADELFVTNVIQGIQPITAFRKKSYDTTLSQSLLAKLNMSVRMS